MTPLTILASRAASYLDALASDIADMPPALPESRAAAHLALTEWERVVMITVYVRRRDALPPWPRWRGVRADPGRLAGEVVGECGSREVEDLADECRRWAKEAEAWDSGEQRGAA